MFFFFNFVGHSLFGWELVACQHHFRLPSAECFILSYSHGSVRGALVVQSIAVLVCVRADGSEVLRMALLACLGKAH